jgi:hypothetical protein
MVLVDRQVNGVVVHEQEAWRARRRRAWREFICPELVGDSWGLAVEQRGERLRGVRAVCLQGRWGAIGIGKNS